jgi:hypothetical protein
MEVRRICRKGENQEHRGVQPSCSLLPTTNIFFSSPSFHLSAPSTIGLFFQVRKHLSACGLLLHLCQGRCLIDVGRSRLLTTYDVARWRLGLPFSDKDDASCCVQNVAAIAPLALPESHIRTFICAGKIGLHAFGTLCFAFS